MAEKKSGFFFVKGAEGPTSFSEMLGVLAVMGLVIVLAIVISSGVHNTYVLWQTAARCEEHRVNGVGHVTRVGAQWKVKTVGGFGQNVDVYTCEPVPPQPIKTPSAPYCPYQCPNSEWFTVYPQDNYSTTITQDETWVK